MSGGKLDPRLRFLQEQSAAERADLAESIRVVAVETANRGVRIDVLLRCRKAPGTKMPRSVEKKLTDLGVTVRSLVDGPTIIVSGSVLVGCLDALLEEDWIEVIEASKQLFPELDLSGADVGVRPLQTVAPTVRGRNVLVGVIDGGIDFRHDDFRLPDGTSRYPVPLGSDGRVGSRWPGAVRARVHEDKPGCRPANRSCSSSDRSHRPGRARHSCGRHCGWKRSKVERTVHGHGPGRRSGDRRSAKRRGDAR